MLVGRIGLCLLGVVAVGGPAVADPIWLTFRVDGYTTRTDAGGVSVQTTLPGPFALDARTNPSAVLATVRLGGKPTLDPGISDGSMPDVAGTSRFILNLHFGDGGPADVGVVRVAGWAENHWGRTFAGDPILDGTTIGFDTNSWDLTVGGRKVQVTATGATGSPDDDVAGTLSVRMPSSLQTPEPGTLVMAGLGVAAAVALRRRVRI
jgi:hypothetical protein